MGMAGMGGVGGKMRMMGGGMAGGGPMGMGAAMGEGPTGGPMGMGMSAGGGQTASSEGEVTWVYQKGQLTYMFLFNKDGRVIQIQEFGRTGGGGTSRGVRLGDTVSKVYRTYGWADSSTKQGNQLTLDYSRKAHVAFQLLDEGKGSKVVGITVALTESTQIPANQ